MLKQCMVLTGSHGKVHWMCLIESNMRPIAIPILRPKVSTTVVCLKVRPGRSFEICCQQILSYQVQGKNILRHPAIQECRTQVAIFSSCFSIYSKVPASDRSLYVLSFGSSVKDTILKLGQCTEEGENTGGGRRRQRE